MVRNKKKPENKSQQKKQTKKQKENEEKQQQPPAIPPEIAQEFRRAGHRFLFNVEQIEKKYCQSSSGMVLNLDTEEYEFDNELCTGDTDEEIIKMINEQKRCLMAPIGEALLSTPAPDPDERDEERLKQCRELNKLCDEVYKKREAEAAEEKKQGNSSAKRCTALVPLGERQIRGGEDQQQGNPFAGFQSADENFLRLSFDMAGRFHIYGNISSFQGFASMLSNSNIPIKIPDEFRGRRLAIQPSMEENEEIGEEGMKKAEPQNDDNVDSTGSSSSSRGSIKRKSEALNPKLLAIECGKADEGQVKRPRLEEAPCCSSTSGSYTTLPVVPQNHLEQPPSCKLPPSFFIPDTPINRIMATGAKRGQNAQTLTSGSAEAEVVDQTPIEDTRAALPPKKQQQQCQSVHSMTLRRANRKWLLGASTPAPKIGGGKAGLGGLGKPEARGAVSTMKRAKGRPRKIMMQ